MASNQDKIYLQYGDGTAEDSRATRSRTSWLEFHYTKKHLSEFIHADSRVLEVGCAAGYYALHFADKCREYVGIDLVPAHIAVFQRKIDERKLTNLSCHVGDATHLDEFADGSVDAVLCLGPMYHLPPEERERAFAECTRVCKQGGVVAFSYINKVGVYAGACVLDGAPREIYPNEQTNDYLLRQGTDDLKPGLFYFTMPEQMEEVAARHGLVKLKNRGTDFMFTMSVVDQMSDEKFAVFMELADEMVRYESCTGMANHALLICRK